MGNGVGRKMDHKPVFYAIRMIVENCLRQVNVKAKKEQLAQVKAGVKHGPDLTETFSEVVPEWRCHGSNGHGSSSFPSSTTSRSSFRKFDSITVTCHIPTYENSRATHE